MGWLSHIIPAHIETVDFQAAIFPQLSIYARVYAIYLRLRRTPIY